MLYFDSDYMQGACPEILERLSKENGNMFPGYGLDPICDSARVKIRKACEAPGAEIFFLEGGTQANMAVLDQLLKPWQAVLAARCGHVSIHEASAIEYTGHEVLEMPHKLGKVAAADVRGFCQNFYADLNHEHMAEPGVLYISQPTECGTMYTLSELEDLRTVCDTFNMRLYVDGARLAYALGCPENDVSLADLARLSDAFYIGGTKCGALFGEAVVFPDHTLADHFFTQMKRHGALLAKGWVLGIQFDELFTNGLYERLGKHAVEQAAKIRAELEKRGYEPVADVCTNQIFMLLTNELAEELSHNISMGFWDRPDVDHVIMRIATSWATNPADVTVLTSILDRTTF